MRVGLLHFNHIMKNGLIGWDAIDTWDWKPNYGDMLVCAAILRQVEHSDSKGVLFGYRAPKNLDYVVMRGSTYLHQEFDFDSAIATLESIQCPVAVVGIGAQSAGLDPTFLDGHEPARRFVSMLAERSKSISCRGAFSAQVLERLGAKSLRITGCPSLFYQGAPQKVSIPPLLESFGRVGLSIHSELGNSIFCRDGAKTRALHGELISALEASDARYVIFEQGNEVELKLSNRKYPFDVRKAAAAYVLERIGLSGKMSEEMLISRFVSVLSVEEWVGKGRDLDAMIGFRFHGNMVGLMQGLPCLYYVYDSRLHEFCELYKLPYQNVEEELSPPITKMIEHDWEAANAAIRRCYDELLAFYQENDVVLSEEFAPPS
ncbi:MAG: polysaccharide pyruvyl transferase family protein [Proteobacteria bacterium]|nr:polysaccharide pyruvyl transferase family protein [Pseudomonadota bacterium]